MLNRLSELVQTNHGTTRGCARLLLAQLEGLLGRLDPWTANANLAVQRLVFVCLGNINRSPFGAELARALGANAVSLGLSTTTGAPATERAVAEASRYGLDLSRHQATNLADYRWVQGDLLLAMEVRHVHRLIAGGIAPQSIALLGHWSRPRRLHLHDPHKLGDAYFATCFALIASAVRELSDAGHRNHAAFVGHPVAGAAR